MRHIIRESLLKEEIFGRQAFVYHGSPMKPKNFLKMMQRDKFVSGVGGGAGEEMGRAMWTVPERADGSAQAATFEGAFGSYIYKLKVSMNGYVAFDEKICSQIYGKSIPIIEQLRLSGEDEIIDIISKRPGLLKWASLGLSQSLKEPSALSKQNEIVGIMSEHGRGAVDSYAVMIFDPSTAVPVAWKYTEDSRYWDQSAGISDPNRGWHPFSEKEIRAGIAKSLDFTPGKLSPIWFFKEIMRGKRVFDRPIHISQSELEEKIPDGFEWPKEPITVNDDLIFGYRDDYPFRELPPNLTVSGNLLLRGLKIDSLPRGLRVKGDLDLSGTGISELPSDARIGGDVVHDDDVEDFVVQPGAKVKGEVLGTSEKFSKSADW